MWLGAVVVAGLLSTVVSLTAAGKADPAGTAGLTTAAARTSASRSVAAPAAATHAAPARAVTSRTSATTAASAGTTKTVAIKNYAFSPSSLTIAVGDTVTWTNEDTAPHTVTVTSGPVTFNSGNLAKGQSFSYTFTVAGTYSYYCAVHPDMVGQVVVTGTTPTPSPAPSPSPSPAPAPSPDPMPMPAPSACGGLQASVDAFMQHFYAAHLQTSLVQQLTDALSVDQYTKTHTVLVENMLKPLVGGAQSALDVFLQHVYAAHLETSPTQQVSDALALDRYIKTHTVLVENMVKPLVGGDLSSC
jgi:plastocyanin